MKNAFVSKKRNGYLVGLLNDERLGATEESVFLTLDEALSAIKTFMDTEPTIVPEVAPEPLAEPVAEPIAE